MKIKLFSSILLLAISAGLTAQPLMIDRVIAVVGDYTILQSDIETQYLQYRAQGANLPDMKCMIFKDLLEQKLLLNQAKIDSLEVSDGTVEMQLDKRMQYFIAQIGSQEELEAYFNKTILEIKNDFRESLRDQLITQQMEGKIAGDVKITPSEVRKFFNRMHPDSIPQIDAEVEIQQIVIYPAMAEAAVFAVKERLLDLRRRIMEGEDFGTLAILYSEDGSAANEGEIGFFSKGELDQEYAKAAFSLKEGGISKIVESEFGFHLIQLISRRDDRVNTRHILMKPKVSLDARQKAISRLDSIADAIRKDSLSFEKAVRLYSQDKNTLLSSGLLVNPATNGSKFELKQLDTKDYLVIRDMQPGDLSDPYEATDEKGKTLYKIVRLKSKTDPHKANLDQDYLLIQSMALEEKREQIIDKWIREKQSETFIHLDDSFKSCEFIKKGWLNVQK